MCFSFLAFAMTGLKAPTNLQLLLPEKKNTLLLFSLSWKKAYDVTELNGLDFRGHLPTFNDGFLSHRLLQLGAGSTLSDTYEQEMGVPQGSILSRVLFSLKEKSKVFKRAK